MATDRSNVVAVDPSLAADDPPLDLVNATVNDSSDEENSNLVDGANKLAAAMTELLGGEGSEGKSRAAAGAGGAAAAAAFEFSSIAGGSGDAPDDEASPTADAQQPRSTALRPPAAFAASNGGSRVRQLGVVSSSRSISRERAIGAGSHRRTLSGRGGGALRTLSSKKADKPQSILRPSTMTPPRAVKKAPRPDLVRVVQLPWIFT
jgi:hypothetical protein